MGLFLLVERLYEYFSKKTLEKKIRRNRHKIAKSLDNIETVIETEEKDVFKSKYNGWTDILDKLDSVKREVRSTKDNVFDVRIEKELEARKSQKELFDAVTDNISALEVKLYSNLTITDHNQYALELNAAINEDLKIVKRALRFNDVSLIKGNLASGINSYLLTVYGKLEKFVPQYTPNPGRVLDNPKKWKVRQSDKEIKAKYGWFLPSLEVCCSYTDREPTVKEVLELNKSNRRYKAQCYMLPKVSNNFKDFVKEYVSNKVGLFVYDLSNKSLIYNNEDLNIKFFKGYFFRKEDPLNLSDVLIAESEGGILTDKQINKFGKNADSALVKLDIVTKMSKEAYFVNAQLGGN